MITCHGSAVDGMDLSDTAYKQDHQTTRPPNTDRKSTDMNNGIPNQKTNGDCNTVTSSSATRGSASSVDGLIWNDGIGSLPGCDNLRFRKNAAGDIELITNDFTDPSATFDQDRPCFTGPDAGEKSFDKPANHRDANAKPEMESGSMRNGQLKCPMCGVSGAPSEFSGRFCSTKCISKNANQRRSISMRIKREQQTRHAAPVEECIDAGEESEARSKDLKIRIRLQSSPSVENATENSRKRKSTSDINPVVPEKKYGRFSWFECERDGGVLAPVSAFEILTGKDPFPGTNQFKLGMALEGVDPAHQSLICPLSVTAVKGFRIRLHFCGYSEGYDFWTNADSPLIFPCGFCEKTGRKLEPPKGLLSENFNWEKYMKKFRLYAAPDVIFSVISEEKYCSFKPEEKLEAVDKHNPDLICAATVADVIGENILIHFDGWTHDFDYWCSASSRLIRPVGWCKAKDKALTPPEGYPRADFSWSVYLGECGAEAASEDSFSLTPPPHGLEKGMKLEAVDTRNPILIRVATIVAIDDYRMQIHFDGWSDIYDISVDLESLDIHPPGWCAKASYPLQPPMTESDRKSVPGQSGCPVPGCIGVGHIRGSKFAGHHSEFGCPYSQQNLHKFKNYLLDRLSKSRSSTSTQEPGGYKSGSDGENSLQDQIRPSKIRRTRKSLMLEAQRSSPSVPNGKNSPTPPNGESKKTVISSHQLADLVDDRGKSHYSAQDHAVFISTLSSYPNYDLPLCWDQQSKILPSVKGIKLKDVAKWSIPQVSSFVSDITGRTEYGKVLAAEEIDGEAFLLLTQSDIAKVLNIKLGPALKIYNAVLLIKAAEHLPV